MNLSKLWTILIAIGVLVQLTTSMQNSLELHTHNWCPTAKIAESIFEKLEQKYAELSEIQFKVIRYSQYHQLQHHHQQIPFPFILVKCNNRTMPYENDITLQQIQYWISIYCLQLVPDCTLKFNNEPFLIKVRPQNNEFYAQLLMQIEEHPHIKVCQTHQTNKTAQEALLVLNQSDKKTLFVDYFSHNIRNYLIKTQKLAVTLISSDANSAISSSFRVAYLSLRNSFNQQKNTSQNLLSFNLPQKTKQNLMFLQLCINRNQSKCSSNKNMKRLYSSSQKMVQRLLFFLDLKKVGEQYENEQFLLAFRFRDNKFQKYIYHEKNIDEKFLFWLQQVSNQISDTSPERQICLSDQLQHRISPFNLEDIESNIRLQKMIEKLKITLITKQKAFHNGPKLKLCLQNEKIQFFENNSQIDQILNIINTKEFKKKDLINEL